MIYDKYKYLYPPRPKNASTPKALGDYSNDDYVAQVKYNGSCLMNYTNGRDQTLTNRHNQPFYNCAISKEIADLHRGKGYSVLIGEYTNKAKKAEDGTVWRDKLILVDMIVHGGQHLLKMGFEKRYETMLNLYDVKDYNEWLYQINDNIFVAKNLPFNLEMYNRVVKTDLHEGLVIKDRTFGLQDGFREDNNVAAFVKFRKSTKNYLY